MGRTRKKLFRTCRSLLPENEYIMHAPCHTHDGLNHCVSGDTVPEFEPSPLDPTWRRPVAAMKDNTVEERVEKALDDFLVEHGLLKQVTRHVKALHGGVMAQGRSLCTNTSACTATVHDLRIRFFEPLLIKLLGQFHNRGLDKEEKDIRGEEYLGFEPRDAPQAPGITFTLTQTQDGYLSRVAMLFEQDSNFASFGRSRNLLARGCKFHLYHKGPIPLDLSNESYGGEAMLNKGRKHCKPRTGQVKIPVRFGMIISTLVNPYNTRESGILYSSIFQTGDQSHLWREDLPYRLWFKSRSVTLMFLAVMLDHLTKVAPPSAIIRRLFGNTSSSERRSLVPVAHATKRANSNEPDRCRAKRARQSHESKRLPPPEWVDVWRTKHEIVRARLNAIVSPASLEFHLWPRLSTNVHMSLKSPVTLEAVTFEVTLLAYLSNYLCEDDGKPPRVEVSLLDPEYQRSEALPFLDAPQFLARGGFGAVHAVRLRTTSSIAAGEDSGWWSVPRPPANAAGHLRAKGRRISMPTDQPVIIKVFDDQIESGIRESILYEHVFPLLPAELRAFLPRYYGTYRPDREQRIVLALGYGGRPLDPADMTMELVQKARAAYRLFFKHGINHGNQEARNILLRDDGSLCLIDWGVATLDFSGDPLRYEMLSFQR
ncbi:BQ2448_4313 [Microbotryum intermedium]|uniref:BQ2448_4313 protein n=1 Tax=Microbotryum intermedium TaxID=269621 RepID=A0A238FNW3_9BASI|nr:BQ2448_4313 [Microbotryum intermedium]